MAIHDTLNQLLCDAVGCHNGKHEPVLLWDPISQHIRQRNQGDIQVQKAKAHAQLVPWDESVQGWLTSANDQVDKEAKNCVTRKHRSTFSAISSLHQQATKTRLMHSQFLKYIAEVGKIFVTALNKKKITRRGDTNQPNVDWRSPFLVSPDQGCVLPCSFSREQFWSFPWGAIFLWRIAEWAKQLQWSVPTINDEANISLAELYVDSMLSTGSTTPRNIHNTKELRAKFQRSEWILDDLSGRVDLASLKFSEQTEIWTRALKCVHQHAPGTIFIGDVVKKVQFIQALGCSYWITGISERPKLTHSFGAAEILAKYFMTNDGSKRSFGRILHCERPKCGPHPKFLELSFHERLQYVTKAKDIWLEAT